MDSGTHASSQRAHDGQPRESKELSEAGGCELLYLPPYPPGFSPIEEACSESNSILRKAEARTRTALVEAMGVAVTAGDARGCSRAAATANRANCCDECCRVGATKQNRQEGPLVLFQRRESKGIIGFRVA